MISVDDILMELEYRINAMAIFMQDTTSESHRTILAIRKKEYELLYEWINIKNKIK